MPTDKPRRVTVPADLAEHWRNRYAPPPLRPKKPEEPGYLRSAADYATLAGRGALGALKSVFDTGGADNPISEFLDSGQKYLDTLQSDYRREMRARHARTEAEAAEKGGWWEEVKTSAENVLEDIPGYAFEAAGSLVPYSFLRFFGKNPVRIPTPGKGLNVSGRTLAAGALSTTMGVGAVKGSQYEEVLQARLSEGASLEEAKEAARRAQMYSLDNAVDLLAGGAAGLVAGTTGAERFVIGRSGLSKAGLIGRAFGGAASEALPEAIQGGQERLAVNRALAREGYDVDPMRGVAGAAVKEGLVTVPIGATTGLMRGRAPTQEEIAVRNEIQRLAAEPQNAPQWTGQGNLFPDDPRFAGPPRSLLQPQELDTTPTVYPPRYYDAPRDTKQLTFLDALPPTYSPVMFDPNLADHPYYGLEAEARRFEDESGGVSGYRGALVGSPGSFTNIVPKRDFGSRQAPTQNEEETAKKIAVLTARLDELNTIVKDKKNPPSAKGKTAMQAEIAAIKERLKAEQALAAAEKKHQAVVEKQQSLVEREAAKAKRQPGLRQILQSEFDRALEAGEITREDHIELTNDLELGRDSLAVKANKLRKTLAAMKAGRATPPPLPGAPSTGASPAAESQQESFIPKTRTEPTPEQDAEQRRIVEKLLSLLSEKERTVLEAYHSGEGETLQEIGYRLDPSKLKRWDAILSSGKPAEQVKKELATLDSAARNDAARTRERAKAKLLAAGARYGLTKESLETYFGDESRRLSGGADVQTIGRGELAQAGTAMHTPGGVDVDVDSETDVMRDLGTGDINLMLEPDERAIDGATDDDADTATSEEETTEIEGVELRGMVDYRGRPIDPDDAELALARWEDLDGEPLPEKFHRGWIKAFVNHKYGGISDAEYGIVYANTSERVAAESRTISETGERSTGRDGAGMEDTTAREDRRGDGEAAPARDAARQPEEKAQRGVTKRATAKEQSTPMNTIAKRNGGQPADTMREKLRKQFVNPKRFDERVVVVQSAEHLPENYRDNYNEYAREGRVIGGFYDPNTNKVYLIADNIPAGRELGVFLHEVGGHMGMRALLGKENFDALYEQINEWAQGGDALENKIAAAAIDRVLNANARKESEVKEETIAYFIEEAVNRGIDPTAVKAGGPLAAWFRRLWNAVRAAVEKLGVLPARLTAQDVVDLAYGAASLQLRATTSDIKAANTATGRPMVAPSVVMDTKAIRAPLDDLVLDKKTQLTEIKLGWMTLDQMADRTNVQSVRDYVDVIHKMQALSKTWVTRAAEIDTKWAKLGEEKSVKLGHLMVQSTLAEYDPTTTAPVNAEQAKIRADLESLGDEAKELYKTVRDFYVGIFNEKRAILTAAYTVGDNPLPKVDINALFSQIKAPYFPLVRSGDWYAVVMSKEVRDLTDKVERGEATKAEELKLAQLRKRPAHYQVRSFGSRSEAERFAKASGYDYTNVNKQEERILSDVKALPNFKVFEDYISGEFDSATRAKLHDLLAEMYFDMLPQTSGLKQQMHREGIAGATFGRAEFARTAESQAHLLSRLKYVNALNEALLKVKNDSRRDVETRLVYNELKKHTALTFDRYTSPRIVDLAIRGSYLANLGLSPAYWITNLMQTPMIAMPWLAARHGFTSTNQALATAFTDTKDILKSSYDKDGWRFKFDWRSRFPEGTGESKLFERLSERSLLDITIEYDLMAIADQRINSRVDDAFKALNTPVRVVEVINRGMTALAAYRLALKKYNGDEEKAINYAIRAVNDTHFNYSTMIAARHMQSLMGSRSLARLVMQFRKFQQGMLYLLFSSAYDAVKGKDKATRNEAKKTLFGITATSTALAGTLGLPAIGSVAFIANMIGKVFDDDDEPFDAEVWYKNWLASFLDNDTANVVARGLPALIGLDLTKRVGLADVANPVPFYREGSTGRESAHNLLAAAAGAPFGTFATIWDGLMKIVDGDVQKGVEQVFPLKLAQTVFRAYRYSEEGLTDSRGNVVLTNDQFDAWDIAMRAIGFQTTKESLYYEANQAVNDAKYAAERARDKLIRNATKNGIRITSDILEFNARHPNMKITYATLLKSMQQRNMMRMERTAYGVRNNKRNAEFMDRAEFAEKD